MDKRTKPWQIGFMQMNGSHSRRGMTAANGRATSRKVSLLIIAWCLLTSLGAAKNAETRVINVAVSARSLAQVAHYVADEKGYYRDEGLEVRLILMSTPIAARALIAGNAEFTGVSGGVLPAIVTGAPLRFVFSAFYRPMFWLYARSDIRDVTALKGKRVAVSGLGSGPATLLLEHLKKARH
jgi:NitT/TauT family transport system substrate-binding protein